jgi:hypothetical protein
LRLPDEKSVPTTSWVAESIFVHFTVSPGDIVIEPGLKAKPCIATSIVLLPAETAGVSAEAAVVGVSAGVAAGSPVGGCPALLPVHPIARNTLNKINKITNSLFILIPREKNQVLFIFDFIALSILLP